MLSFVKDITAWFIIIAPILILIVDYVIFVNFGESATITGVVRAWNKRFSSIEVLYLVGVAVLYVHLFRGWPK